MTFPPEVLEMARTYSLLSEMDPQQLRKLLPIAEERTYIAGEIIFREGDRSSYLHLIASGEVALETNAGGRTVRVQTLGPGDAMGWSALMTESRTRFQARALTPVSTVAFASSAIREACDRDPAMGYELMKRLLELVTQRLDAARIQVLAAPVA